MKRVSEELHVVGRDRRAPNRSLTRVVAACCEPLEKRLLLATTAYRINAGGPALSGTPAWSSDSKSAPSAYTNASAAGSSTYSTTTAIDMTHASLPAGTPAALFQTERYDAASGAEMEWNFPVTAGPHEVRLYFAEIYSGAQTAGQRKFDVYIENALVLNDYDVFADAGGYRGVMKSFTVHTDGNLDIDFGHVTQNPAIKGIEIISLGSVAGTLGASTSGVDFGSAAVNQPSSKVLTLTNLGAAGDNSIVIDSTNITGANASMFSDNFNDAGSITLAPGQSTDLTVQFQPTSAGIKTASLNIVHNGVNSPLVVPLAGSGQTSSNNISFGKSALAGTNLTKPTSLQFGPDGRLYVAQQNGLIKVHTVTRTAANNYSVTATETITAIQSIPNHNDDGTLNTTLATRLVTGLLVTGTATNPVMYVTSSDPRIGAGTSGEDLNLDTNSGIISRLTWNGSSWTKVDLVRGLPRSEENHTANGMQLDATNQVLYVTIGGNTNMGAPSNNFANLPEYALSAAILAIDLAAIGSSTYDIPTLNDEDRAGTADLGDPFGGNDGKNQAVLVSGGPVSVYAPGFRNPYDVVITRQGKMFTIDNGSNAGWGGEPLDPDGNVTTAATRHLATNQISEPGTTDKDGLHLITGAGYYGGHANPTRANTANTFNTSNPQSPVDTANPIEGEYLIPGVENSALALFPESTNGLVEYVGSFFGGAMDGDLLTVAHDGKLYRIELADDGTTVLSSTALFSSISSAPLDVTVPTSGTLAGTIWVADWYQGGIYVFEPATSGGTGAYDPNLDEDADGYDNADEIDNGTDPLSAADFPPDYDADFTSNLTDPDDDNDTILDTTDFFAVDASNGTTTSVPVIYTWDNDAPAAGGLLQLGFTGLMSNGTSNYASLFDQSKMTTGGAAGVLTIDEVSGGTAWGAANNQQYGFQFGVHTTSSTAPFSAHTRVLAPFSGLTPQAGQNMGLHVGLGDQDNYFKLVVSGSSGGSIQFGKEINGAAQIVSQITQSVSNVEYVDLYLIVNPADLTVSAAYSAMVNGTLTPLQSVGTAQPLPISWLANSALAVGINSTSGTAPTFSATYDFIEVLNWTPSQLGASPSSHNFGTVAVGQTQTQTILLTNQGSTGDPAIIIDSTSIVGTQAAAFSDDFNDAGSVTLQPGQSTALTLSFTPTTGGAASATLQVHHSGSNSPLTIGLSGTGQQSTSSVPLYRVNAGGPQVTGSLNWGTDTSAAPSPYSNYAAAQSRTSSTTAIVDMTHPSVPAGTPSQLFQTERYDPIGGSEMLWSFPVTPNAYEVRLYFAETYAATQVIGARLMDILIESQLVLDDYDVFADVGANRAVAKVFTVNADSSLDIQFRHVKNNPNIKAIEIVPVGTAVNQLGVATSLDFGNVPVNQQQSRSLVLTHLGSAGDAPIVLDSTTITGSDAALFSDAFNDAGTITLQPGQSYTLDVGFLSTTTGAKSATLQVQHSGSSSPAVVSLTANAVAQSASSAVLSITPTASLKNGSTYTAQSFSISNTSQNGAKIQSITIDLSTAIFPDMVFDPNGTAGDTATKTLTVDVNGGVGTVTYEFLGARDGGYDSLKINFTDFNAGEQMKFSIDVDPTSIKGVASPGPRSAGSVTGVELTGATVSASFSDLSNLTARVHGVEGTNAGGQALIRQNAPQAPTISALGITGSQAQVTQAAQTIRVTGTVGDTVTLTVIEGGLFLTGVPNGGYDIDPYEANTALAVRYFTGTIGASGYVDIPVTLTKSLAEGGINYISASVKLPDGLVSLSNFLTLDLDA